MKGRCSYGRTCQFSHDVSPWDIENERSFERSVAKSKKLCLDFKKGNCTYGDKCSFSHALPALERCANVPCLDFKRGYCSYGEKCAFSHNIHEDGQARVVRSGSRRPQIGKPCLDFQKGTCTYGNDCRFAHGKEDCIDVNERKIPMRVSHRLCLDFKKGRCTYGENCSFSHATSIVLGDNRRIK